MTRGRPSSYDPSFCDRVVELGNEGASVVEMAVDIGVGRTTLERDWPSQHEEFSQALAHAREASQAWWERKGREGLEKTTFNSAVWSRSMAARFPHDWREKKELELSGHLGGALDALPDDGATGEAPPA